MNNKLISKLQSSYDEI